MNRLEALALSIAREHQSFEPSSEAFQTLNPGLLKSHSVDRLNVVNSEGTRIFTSFQGGYRALHANLLAKCSGKTKANGDKGWLAPDSSLSDLCKTFRYINTRSVVEFLQDVLEDKAITERTPLQFFIEG